MGLWLGFAIVWCLGFCIGFFWWTLFYCFCLVWIVWLSAAFFAMLLWGLFSVFIVYVALLLACFCYFVALRLFCFIVLELVCCSCLLSLFDMVDWIDLRWLMVCTVYFACLLCCWGFVVVLCFVLFVRFCWVTLIWVSCVVVFGTVYLRLLPLFGLLGCVCFGFGCVAFWDLVGIWLLYAWLFVMFLDLLVGFIDVWLFELLYVGCGCDRFAFLRWLLIAAVYCCVIRFAYV